MFSNGLLPPGIHSITAEKFIAVFGFNPRRRQLCLGLQLLCRFLQGHHIGIVYVDGSYVEQKEWPKDIDTFFEVRKAQFNQMFIPFGWQAWHKSMVEQHKCDAYVCISDQPGPFEAEGKRYQRGRDYWLDKFGHTREGIEKGFVSLKTKDVVSIGVTI